MASVADRAVILAQISGHLAQAHSLASFLKLTDSDWQVLLKPLSSSSKPLDTISVESGKVPDESPVVVADKPAKAKKEPKAKRPMTEKQQQNEEAYKTWFTAKITAYEERKAAWTGPGDFAEEKPHYIRLKKSYAAEKEAALSDEERAAKVAAAAAKKTRKPRAKKTTESKPTESAPESDDEAGEFWPLTLDGKNYIYDELHNCWELAKDGSKGSWAGVFDPTTNSIDDTAKEPAL